MLFEIIDQYFLTLVIGHSIVVGYFDSYSFKKEKRLGLSIKASLIGNSLIIISIILFVIAKLF
jgi:hypothetical protein